MTEGAATILVGQVRTGDLVRVGGQEIRVAEINSLGKNTVELVERSSNIPARRTRWSTSKNCVLVERKDT